MSDDPATQYKEIIGRARGAHDLLRLWEQGRAEQLEHEIATASAAVTAATEREQQARDRVGRWWRMAVDSVSQVSWLEVGPEPEPAAGTRGSYLERHLDDVRHAYHELTQAILNLGWRARR
jgi:hypothetical protein